MTAWVQGRTSWLSKPPMQSKRSAASGCTSAAVQWVHRMKQLTGFLIRYRSPIWAHLPCQLMLFFWLFVRTGAGSVHLQGAVGFFWLRSDVRQVLRPEKWTGAELVKQNHGCIVIAKKCNPFLFFFLFLCVFQAVMLPEWHSSQVRTTVNLSESFPWNLLLIPQMFRCHLSRKVKSAKAKCGKDKGNGCI